MKQINIKSPSLFKWFSEHDTSLEKLGETDRRVHLLIDQYLQLMDAIEYWGQESDAQNGAFNRLLRSKELEIIEIISAEKGTLTVQI